MNEAYRDDDSTIHHLINETFRLESTINAQVARTLTELELTEALAGLLWRLAPEAPPMSMRRLAEDLVCDPTNVTFLADRLEKRGLLERRRDSTDRRVTVLALTPAGVELRNRLLSAAASQSPFRRLPKAEQEQLLRLLAKVNRLYLADSQTG